MPPIYFPNVKKITITFQKKILLFFSLKKQSSAEMLSNIFYTFRKLVGVPVPAHNLQMQFQYQNSRYDAVAIKTRQRQLAIL